MAQAILTSTPSHLDGNLYYYHLPKAQIQLKVVQHGEGDASQVEMEEISVTIEPDSRQRLFFRYSPNPFTSDEITLSFSEQGFLSRIHTQIDDQTGQFLNQLVDLGTSVAELVAVPGSRTRSVETRTLFEGKIDPFDEKRMAELNAYLQQHRSDLSLSIQRLHPLSNSTPVSPKKGMGIYCRPMDQFLLTLEAKQGKQEEAVRLPDPEQLHFIALPKAAWVKTDFQMDFDAYGYPTQIRIHKPSTALAILEVPLRLVRAILDLPARLFQFRINLDSARQNALQQQLDMQRSMRDLEDQYRQRNQESKQRGVGGTETMTESVSQNGNARQKDDASELNELVQKLQQDLDIMRRRMNDA